MGRGISLIQDLILAFLFLVHKDVHIKLANNRE